MVIVFLLGVTLCGFMPVGLLLSSPPMHCEISLWWVLLSATNVIRLVYSL